MNAFANARRSFEAGTSGASPLRDQSERILFDWSTATGLFGMDPTVRVTGSRDTIVHFAVVQGRRSLVRELIFDVLKTEEERKQVLLSKNVESGSTALHLAAAHGDREMCELILTSVQSPCSKLDLIGARNDDGETPLFVAALHGKMEPFFVLYNKLKEAGELTQMLRYIRRKTDGNTILHVAILGDHLDLAFQIIKIYQDLDQMKDEENVLANMHNEKGQTALHILAESPHWFKSRNYNLIRLTFLIDTLFYRISSVDRLEKRDGQSLHEEKTLFPENYRTFVDLVKLFWKPFEYLRGRCRGRNEGDAENPAANQNGGKDGAKGKEKENKTTTHLYDVGWSGIWERAKNRKQIYTWAVQILEELVKAASGWEYNADGKRPPELGPSFLEMDSAAPTQLQYFCAGTFAPDTNYPGRNVGGKRKGGKGKSAKKTDDTETSETPILLAAKNGVVEMVDLILHTFPAAIRDVNKEGKNVLLLAAENRQFFVYKLFVDKKFGNDTEFQRVDKECNSALHLAAKLGNKRQPWNLSGVAALHILWEIKWFRFVQGSMPPNVFRRVNREGRTATEIFYETHGELVRKGGEWLNTTSQSCSVVAALIATVAFAAAVAVPGGVKDNEGTPIFAGKPAFTVFAISTVVALVSSIISLIAFLSIVTSSGRTMEYFERNLPLTLKFGVRSLYVSIWAILVSFSSGHYFILSNYLKSLAFALYAFACYPVVLLADAHFGGIMTDIDRAIKLRAPHPLQEKSFY